MSIELRPATEALRYSIDRDELISSVSAGWTEFAVENGAPQIAADLVLGHLLWEFVSGQATRHVYEQLFEGIRAGGDDVSVPFRCDGPGVRRYMRLLIRDGDDGIDFISYTLREEERPPLELFRPEAQRSTTLVVACSSCRRIEASSTEWLEAEAAVHVLGIFAEQLPPTLAYSVCSDCREALLAEPPSPDRGEEEPGPA